MDLMTPLLKTGRAGGAIALVLAASVCVALAQPKNPSVAIDDDGKEVAAPQRNATTSPSFAGAGRALRLGEKDDARANPQTRLEDEQTERRVRRAKPIRPASTSGGVTPETIIGSDDRTRVNPTTTFPARATALVLFSDGFGSDFLCSGFLISEDTVATAGHCVAPGNGTGFYPRASYRVFPGRNANDRPYGVCRARRLFSVSGWLNDARDDFDYGAIKLNCDIGNTTGWYGFTNASGGVGTKLRVQGYPGDKPLTQWMSNDQIRVLEGRRIYYRADTVGGMSGSPVWINKDLTCTRCAIAVHAYGTFGGTPPDSNSNHGTRINDTVFTNLTAWKDMP